MVTLPAIPFSSPSSSDDLPLSLRFPFITWPVIFLSVADPLPGRWQMKRRRDEEVQRDEVILSALFLPPAPGALDAELRFLCSLLMSASIKEG